MPTTGIALDKKTRRRLRTERERLGLSQVAVGKMVGVGQSLIAEIESGAKQPTAEVLNKLCRKYSLRMEQVRLIKKR